MLTNPAKQLLNWARKAALMNEDDFSKEYNAFSATALQSTQCQPIVFSPGILLQEI
jgi:hypothetical protein